MKIVGKDKFCFLKSESEKLDNVSNIFCAIDCTGASSVCALQPTDLKNEYHYVVVVVPAFL